MLRVVHVPRWRCCASYYFVLACVLMCNSLGWSFSLIVALHVLLVYKENLHNINKRQKSPEPKGEQLSTTRKARNKKSGRYRKKSEGGPVRASGRRQYTQRATIQAKMTNKIDCGLRENRGKRLRFQGKQSVRGKCVEDVQPTTVEDVSTATVTSVHDIYRVATESYKRRKGAHVRPTKIQSVLGQDDVSTLGPIPSVQRIVTKGAQASGLMMSRVGDTKTIRLCRKVNMDVRTQEVQVVGRIGY